MKLSQRLTAIADHIPVGSVVADIGADRGELPFALLRRGVAAKVILTDISPRSLERAKTLFHATDEAKRAEFRVGNGLSPLRPGEADVAVFAGMGGLTIADILKADPAVTRSLQRMVIQAMGNSDKVRRCLGEIGFTLTAETMVAEEGQFYAILCAEPGEAHWDETELFAGPLLLQDGNATLAEYLKREKAKAERLLAALQAKNEGKARQEELSEALARIDDAAKRLTERK